MKRIDYLKNTIKNHKKELKEIYKVAKIGIFGSYIRGEDRKYSDLDILVEFDKPVSLFDFLDLEEYLRRTLSLKVDLVSARALKPNIGKYIRKEVQYI